jgi:predicted glycosyltransferase
VPRARPRAEQAIRAERLAQRGLLEVLHIEALSPEALGRWMRAAATPSAEARRSLHLGGLDRCASWPTPPCPRAPLPQTA